MKSVQQHTFRTVPNRSRQLRGVFSVGKVAQDPRPIVFGISVLAGVLSRWDCMGHREPTCFCPIISGLQRSKSVL
jgi:hypothetical protein